MSREKQIEEMARAVNERIHEEVSMDKVYGVLYDAGYRKQSDVTDINVGSKSEWISVEERLPNESGKYICCTTKGTILIERFYQLDDGGWFSSHNFCTTTHWMPLPEAPKMKGE